MTIIPCSGCGNIPAMCTCFSNWEKVLRRHFAQKEIEPAKQCFCTGPKNGEPLCPCKMRDRKLFKRDGRWIEPEKDQLRQGKE